MRARNTATASTLESLYLAHESRVRWLLLARGIPTAAIDDLVHDTFVAIHRRWPERDRSVPVATWVSGVARNVAFTYRRSEARRHRQLQQLPPRAPEPEPDDTAARREAWEALLHFTHRLSPKLREAFVLVDVGGMPANEAAHMTDVPVATLHSRLRLARSRFTEHFAELRSEDARRAALRQARAEQHRSETTRRRSLAAVLAAVEQPPPPPPIPGGWLSAGKLATVAAASGLAVAVAWSAGALQPGESTQPSAVVAATRDPAEPSEPSDNSGAREGEPDRVSSAHTVASVDPVPHVDHPAPTPRASIQPERRRADPAAPTLEGEPSAADARPTEPDPLAAHVRALDEARRSIRAGAPDRALTSLDGVASPVTSLMRDHHRLALQASCEAGRPQRAREAAGALAALGLRDEGTAPCAESPSEGTK